MKITVIYPAKMLSKLKISFIVDAKTSPILTSWIFAELFYQLHWCFYRCRFEQSPLWRLKQQIPGCSIIISPCSKSHSQPQHWAGWLALFLIEHCRLLKGFNWLVFEQQTFVFRADLTLKSTTEGIDVNPSVKNPEPRMFWHPRCWGKAGGIPTASSNLLSLLAMQLITEIKKGPDVTVN